MGRHEQLRRHVSKGGRGRQPRGAAHAARQQEGRLRRVYVCAQGRWSPRRTVSHTISLFLCVAWHVACLVCICLLCCSAPLGSFFVERILIMLTFLICNSE